MKTHKYFFGTVMLLVTILISVGAAQATPLRLLLERDIDSGAGNKVFMASFNSYTDLINSNLSSGEFSSLDIAPSFSAGGLAYEFSESQPVPEPSPLLLMSSGLIGFAFVARRRRNN